MIQITPPATTKEHRWRAVGESVSTLDPPRQPIGILALRREGQVPVGPPEMATTSAAAAGAAQFGPSTSSSSSSTSSFMVGQGIFFLVSPHIFFGNVTMLIEILRSEGGGRVVVAWELSAKIGRHHVHWPASPR